MPRTALVLALAALALLAPTATASAADRFVTCVRESPGCSHRFTGGSNPQAFFKDRRRAGTLYRLCLRSPGGQRVCARDRTERRGLGRIVPLRLGSVGRYRVSWFVGGRRVGVWRFRYVRENA